MNINTVMDSLREIADSLRNLDNILIFPHVNIDGDALGSSSALCLCLRKLGKKAYIVYDEEVPDNLDFLEQGLISKDGSELSEVGLSMLLDCGDYSRIGKRREAFNRGAVKGCIDHHAVGENDISFDFIFRDASAAATGEIIYFLVKELLGEIDLDIANSIFAAITTDTGNFQHSNTTELTHRVASELYRVEGFSSKPVSSLIYDRKSISEFKLENVILSGLEFYSEDRIAVGTLTQELLQTLGCKISQADAVIQRIMSIEGVEIGVLLKEQEDGQFKASLRAKSYADVASVAAKFGGGGHLRASGCTLGKDIVEKKYMLIDELSRAVNR